MRVLWSRALSIWVGREVKKKTETNRVGMVRGWENITERAFLVARAPRARIRIHTTHSHSHGAEGKTHLYLFLNKNILHKRVWEGVRGGGQQKEVWPVSIRRREGKLFGYNGQTGKGKQLLPSEWNDYNCYRSDCSRLCYTILII